MKKLLSARAFRLYKQQAAVLTKLIIFSAIMPVNSA